jgi:hypothetical protein
MPLMQTVWWLIALAAPGFQDAAQSKPPTSAAAPAPLPSAKLKHQEIVQNLALQSALCQCVKLQEKGEHQQIIEKLEPLISQAGGSEKFLELLDAAYRQRIAGLVKEHKETEAELYRARLDAIGRGEGSASALTAAVAKEESSTEGAPVTIPAAAGEPKKLDAKAAVLAIPLAGSAKGADSANVRTADAAREKTKDDERNWFQKVFGKGKEKPPETKAEEPYVARGKIDDRPAAMARPADAADADLEKAEDAWKRKDFVAAHEHYQRAYRANPTGKVQEARNKFGYVKLWAAQDRFEKQTSDPKAPVDEKVWAEWESEVKQGKSLVDKNPLQNWADEQLSVISQRREAVTKAARDLANAATAPLLGKKTRGAFRHLGGQSQGGWQTTETANFRILHRDRKLAEETAAIAEDARERAHQLWFANEPQPDWDTKCDLILYPTAAEFDAQNPDMPGSPALTQCNVPQRGVVTSRLIKLRADEPNMKGAILPHEVAHAVFAGRFGGFSPPKWADEGLAVLTEPVVKQNQHLIALLNARASRQGFTCQQVMTMQSYPPQVREFYAASVGVCRFLVARGGREKLTAFIRQSTETRDSESALVRVYGIRGFEDLESQFAQYLADMKAGDLGGAVATR